MAAIQNYLSGLSTSEKLTALDFLWNELELKHDDISSLDWHADVINQRLSNPSAEQPLPLDDAISRIRERIHARNNLG